MAKKIIDMSQSPRAGQFAYFSAMADPWAGATVMVDITDFLSAIREKGLPFFLSFLFAVTRAGNAVPELRRRLLPDGTVVEYDLCQPSYTAMRPNGVYVYCLVDSGVLPYEDFVADGKRRQAEALAARAKLPETEKRTAEKDGDLEEISSFMTRNLGLKVKISAGRGGGGKVVLQYANPADLDKIIDILRQKSTLTNDTRPEFAAEAAD